jgi:hypothetical protein
MAAEALMNVHAWNYTVTEASSELRPDALQALALLDTALQHEPAHILALHLKIHLLEAQPLQHSEAGSDGGVGGVGGQRKVELRAMLACCSVACCSVT